MTAPACRKGLRRKNGRKANFRQVQTSAARSFGSQSNPIINTASVRNARRFPHLTKHLRGHRTCGAFDASSPRESPEIAKRLSGVQRWRPRRKLDPGHPPTRIPGARKEKKKRSPLAPERGRGLERPICDWPRERVRGRISE